MADGFRVTESGDYRITEASVFRITEKFFEGFSSVSGSSSLTPLGVVNYIGNSSIQGTGTFSATGLSIVYAASLVSNNSSISATPTVTKPGNVSLTANSSKITAGIDYYLGYAHLTANSSFTEQSMSIKYGQITSSLETYTRITEAGDTRVTEDGLDTRITNDISNSLMVGSIVAEAIKIPFTSTLNIKYSGNWVPAYVSVKYNGNWVLPEKIYRKQNGVWIRIF